VPVRVEWVSYGRPAADALRATIAEAKRDDPLSEVTVVVPSNHVGVAVRRLLASGDLGPVASHGLGIAAVNFLTVYRLAELLGAARLAGAGRRPVSTPVIAAALRTALKADPGMFAPVAEHPATEMALVQAYRELRDVSPEACARLRSESERAADVVRLHAAARRLLEEEFSDEEDLIGAALEELVSDQAHRLGLGRVVVFLPQRLSRHGSALLAALADHAEVRVLAGVTGDTRSDVEVMRSVHAICPDAAAPPEADPLAVVSTSRTRIVTTSDADDEVRAGVRAVIDAARDGIPLERIALLYGSREPYGRLVHEQLDAAGIKHNGSAIVPLTARMAGRTLLGLIDLPASGFRRADVFAWLAGARLRHRGRSVPGTAWERLSRDAGVVAGRGQWDRLLAAVVVDLEDDAAALDPDAPDWRAERLAADAAHARELREFVLGLIDDLTAASARPRGWADHASWARGRLDDLLGGPRHRSGWPLVEAKAAEQVERALDRLACLERVEAPVSLDVFARTLELELEADLGRVGRIGDGVLAASVRMGVGLDLDLVVLLGLVEGSFPTPVHDDSLLPDEERQAAEGELGLRAEETERQHHELLATLAGAGRHLLCVPRGDLRRSNERIASRWVTDVAGVLAGARQSAEDLAEADAPWVEHVASFDAGLRAVAFPATEQEHRLRSMLAGGVTELATSDSIVAAGVEMVSARRSPYFTRFDGNLGGLTVPSPVGATISATRLEGWAVCPFAYFVKEILRVDVVESPEDRLQISALDLGSLIHQILEDFVKSVLARPEDQRPAAGEPWSGADRAGLLAIAERICDEYEAHGRVGRPIFWHRDRRRILADLERFLREDNVTRGELGSRPVAAELAFGMRGGEIGPVALPLPDGRVVRFRGLADRLDVGADGTLEVVDYKTGRPDHYTGLSEDDPDARGTRLQLVVYALAARLHQERPDAPVRADYWFTTAKGGFKRIGYRVTADVLERVGATVSRMSDGIEAGVFPHHPTETSTSIYVQCEYCDPDALGVVDLRRQIERKKGDPAVAAFFDLAEGGEAELCAEDLEIGEAPDG